MCSIRTATRLRSIPSVRAASCRLRAFSPRVQNPGLSPLSPATVVSGTSPTGVTVDPSGRFVYVTNFGGNTLSQFNIGAGGVLLPMNPASVLTGAQPGLATIGATEQYAYVTNFNAGNAGSVSQYTVGVAGGLTLASAAPVATGKGPSMLVFDGTGRFAYVPNIFDNTVSQYAVGNGGVLVPLTTPVVSAGIHPNEISTSY
jgi:6-phosphogluconolactonase (cycloisomerase 2 family)